MENIEFKTFKVITKGYNFEEALLNAKKEASANLGILYFNFFDDESATYRKREGDQKILDKLEASLIPVCYGVQVKKPLSNKNKIKSTAKTYSQHGTRTWYTKYIVCKVKGGTLIEVKDIEPLDKKADAINAARIWTGENRLATVVKVAKILDEDHTEVVAEVSYKKSSRERLGTFIFYGKVPTTR